jgi:oligoribonuclease (3'-5' exoribonuclease)
VGYAACLRLPEGYVPNGWAREHLKEVLEGCARSSLAAAEVDRHLAAWIDAAVGPPAEKALDRPVLAGSSLHHDWFLARRDLPLFSARLSYRHLDVTALKLEVRNHYFPTDPPKLDKKDPAAVRRQFPRLSASGGQHDALYDAQASAAELALYRAALRGR